jgi:hypothetical protein
MLRLAIPEIELSIAPRGAEGAVLWMKRYGVDGVDIRLIFVVGVCLAVALEAKIIARVPLFDVLNRAPALDAADGEAVGCGGEAADHTGLEFQRGLDGLVEGFGLVEVDNVDVAIGGADDEQLAAGVEGVDAVLVFDCDGGFVGAEIPIFDLFCAELV